MASSLMGVWRDTQRLHKLVSLPVSRQVLFLGMNITLLALQMPTPFIVNLIVNGLGRPDGFPAVFMLIALALALMFGALIVGAWLRIEAVRQTLDCRVRLQLRLFRELMQCHALALPVKQVSEVHARFTQDLGIIQNLWPAGRIFAFRYLLTIFAAVAALFYIDLILTMSIAVFLPIAIIGFRYFGKRLAELATNAQQQFGASNGVLLECISAAPLAVMAGTDDFHVQRLLSSQQSLRDALACSFRWSTTMETSLSALPLIISALIWTLGGTDVQMGKHTAGDLVSYSLILSILYGPINNLLSISSAVVVEGVSLGRLLQLIQVTERNTVDLAYIQPLHQTGKPPSIELDSLIYERDGERLFDDLSVKIAPGNCVALRGANGSGKSTLIGLIYGSQPVLASQILIDGIRLSHIDITTRCQIFSFLPQDVMVFSDTLRNNIALGRAVTDIAIENLCRRLGMLDFLCQWPQKLDTLIEEGGRNISGGERQRIGLLRTLIVRTPVLLLDEPEQNLDLQVLQSLVAYIEDIKDSCTCLLVTHSDAFNEIIDQTVEIKRGVSDF
jgi:ABC-type multidrug transport system fused ATPase/permease subunit